MVHDVLLSICSKTMVLQESLMYRVWLFCTAFIVAAFRLLMSLYTAALDCPLRARQPPGRGQWGTNRRVRHNGVQLEQGLFLGGGGFAEVRREELSKSPSRRFCKPIRPSPSLRDYMLHCFPPTPTSGKYENVHDLYLIPSM